MKQLEICKVDYIETDSSGQYIIGTKHDDVIGVIFVDVVHTLTIDFRGKLIVDITEE